MGTRADSKRTKQTNLVPVTCDFESLSCWAARALCEMARRRDPALADLTLCGLRSILEEELDELREALQELDLLIEERGADQKAILLDLDPKVRFTKLRERYCPRRAR